MAKKLTREEIFKKAAEKMRSDFEELRLVPHNATKGAEAEQVFRKFLNTHIPQRFSVGSGFIVDPKGEVSNQTDVVVYDAFNCPVYRASDSASIFPSTNVAAVVEVKSSLDKHALKDAWKKIAAIKSLSKRNVPRPGPTLYQTAGYVFAFESKISLEKVADHYRELFFSEKNGLGQHIDAIAVLDRGVSTLAANIPGQDGWNTIQLEGLGGEAGEGTHLAVSAIKFGDYTLDGFLRLLLARLSLYHGVIDHPGFKFEEMPNVGSAHYTSYLTTIRQEQDPIVKHEKLKQYAKEAQMAFAKGRVQLDDDGKQNR